MAKRDLSAATKGAANAGIQMSDGLQVLAKEKAEAEVRAKAEAEAAKVDRFRRAAEVAKTRPNGYASVPDVVASPSVHMDAGEEGGDAGAKGVESVVSDAATSALPGRLMSVLLEDIDENPYNARRIYKPGEVERLAVSITRDGQIVPGIATMRKGRYVLVGGHFRLRALKYAKMPAMQLVVYPSLTERQLYEWSFKENNDRNNQTALDNAIAWRDVLDRKLYASAEELAEANNLSPANVSKTLSILKLTSEVRTVVEQKPEVCGLSTLYELSMLEAVAGTKEAMRVANLIINEEITRDGIIEIRDRFVNPRTRRKKQTSRHYTIRSGEREVGLIKDFPDGRVMFEVHLDDPDEREALVEHLKDRFRVE